MSQSARVLGGQRLRPVVERLSLFADHEVFVGDGPTEMLLDVVPDALQELFEEEWTAKIGAARNERTDTRTSQRNTCRDRLVSTPARDAELKIPKPRKGSFFPELLKARWRVDRVPALAIGDHGLDGTMQVISDAHAG